MAKKKYDITRLSSSKKPAKTPTKVDAPSLEKEAVAAVHGEKIRMNFLFTPDLKRRLKIKSAELDMSMTEVVIEAVEEYLRK